MRKLFWKSIAFFTLGCLMFVTLMGCNRKSTSNYPNKPIELLCIHKPGASTDIVARTLQPYLSSQLGQQVVVQNVTGGGGLEAMSQLNKADPDGYTLLITPFPSAVIKQVINKDVGFDLMDFTFIEGVTAKDNNVLAVATDSPIKTIDDLKKASDLKISGSGIGTNGQLAAALLKDKGKVNLTYVPFEGGPEAINAVLGKQVDATVANIVGVAPLVSAGKMRIVGTFGPERDARYPDAPTFAESGMPDVSFESETGIVGPPNMPADVLKVLRDAISKVVNNTDVQSVGTKVGITVMEISADKLKADAAKQFDLVTAEKSILAGTGQ